MFMVNKIFFSEDAVEDLKHIQTHYNEVTYNKQIGDKCITKILKRISILEEFPEIAASLSTIIDVDTDYRYLVCDRYLTFYRYDSGIVYIIRILDSRQDYMSILF